MKSLHMTIWTRSTPKGLSNTVWAFTTAGVSDPRLYEKVADAIVALGHLEDFKPQAISNTLWAFANAEVSHPRLFEKVADHIMTLDHLGSFNSQDITNTVWAYATAEVSHPYLFEKMANAAIEKQDELNSKEIANLLWAYANVGQIYPSLFSPMTPPVKRESTYPHMQRTKSCKSCFDVCNFKCGCQRLFRDHFISACLEKKDGFTIEEAIVWMHS